MTRPLTDYSAAMAMLASGVSQAETARRTGIPRSTIRTWVKTGRPGHSALPENQCDPCPHIARVRELQEYAYLLGLYLGDGDISATPRGVYRLRVSLDERYPGIIDECGEAMGKVFPNKVGRVKAPGCRVVWSYSKHWPCVFPQHGPGPKHKRPIVLEPWQEEVALGRYPTSLLRGLVHSDGWRGTNVAVTYRGRYWYPRYQFCNHSADIREIFVRACAAVGVTARPTNRWNLAVSRREDVALLDQFIGLKR